MPPDPRVASLAYVGALAAFVAAVRMARRPAIAAGDPLAGMQAVELEVREEAGTRSLRSPPPVTIGRAPDATVVVSDLHVSRHHARIDRMDGVLIIRDLDSRNGTLVNGRPIVRPTTLRDGDRIDVGRTRIVVTGVAAWN